jgi:glycosyltransferase involved in cell wall biosynthesis
MLAQKKIKIRMLVNDALLGGAEMMVADVLRSLDSEYFDSEYWYLRDITKTEEKTPTLRNRFNESDVSLVNLNIQGFVQGISRIAKRLKSEKVQILHCHLPDAVIMGGLAAIIVRVPFIIHEHQTHGFHSWKIRFAYRLLRPFATLTICFSDVVETQEFGSSCVLTTPPNRINRRSYTIPNCIDMKLVSSVQEKTDLVAKRKELKLEESDVVIVSVARLVPWKGHRLLIEAFSSVARAIPNAKLCIVGGGSQLEDLQSYVNVLGLQSRVNIFGSRTDIYEILSISDIFSLVFTYPEGTDGDAIGIAGFEAMAFGLPIVIGDYRNAEQYIKNGESGVVVPPRNSVLLANALIYLAADKAARKKIGSRAHEVIEQHLSLSGIIPIYETIYQLINKV